ncbi:hypothetical protein [Flavobacterium okayamense]|uniref:hypothetical protein n=1 Tax=Flavobacterium okayamense TaxID=2830782 RepID=UPI001C850725|nr:hypothetical protein [Flavobacterium okayamense]
MNINKFTGILIIGMNAFYFIPETVKIILTGGGPFGFGLLILPFTLFLNLFTIPSILILTNKYKNRKILTWINLLGLFICAFCLGYFIRSAE